MVKEAEVRGGPCPLSFFPFSQGPPGIYLHKVLTAARG